MILLALVAVAAGAWWLRHPGTPPAAPRTAGVPESSPEGTARVLAVPGGTADDSHFHPPKLLTSRPVRYPEEAFFNRVEGVVRVRFSVDETGHVTNVLAAQVGSVLLDAMVLDYDLRQWTFQPATLDGKPVPGTVEKEFEFRLDPAEQRTLATKRLAAPVGTPDAPYPKEALAFKNRPQGACTIEATWTKEGGLVDTIHLAKSSDSYVLDRAALRFAYLNWRIDPAKWTDQVFSKTMTFAPPLGPNDTPPPLLDPQEPSAPPPATP